MNTILRILPWKRGLIVSLVILILVDIFSFYGLYTNKFYFFKFDNYLLPLLSIVHFVYLYVLWFKITENEVADPQMRNLEYGLYVIIVVYGFKLCYIFYILISSGQFEDRMIPATFMPVGIFSFMLHMALLGITFLAFKYRKNLIGGYNFDEINQIDSWD